MGNGGNKRLRSFKKLIVVIFSDEIPSRKVKLLRQGLLQNPGLLSGWERVLVWPLLSGFQ
jgi:hypothetical protein